MSSDTTPASGDPPASASSASSAAEWTGDVTALNFEQDVVVRSQTLPVVLDFWATWCGPCKTLGPLLDKLVAEAGGRFFLGKIDVDQNPELAQTFQVQSIPMVLALNGGKIVDGFTGLREYAELREFVEKLIGGPLGGHEPGAAALEQAAALEEAGDAAGAAALLLEHLETSADDDPARLRAARLLADLERTEEARAALDALGAETAESPEASSLRRRLELLESGTDVTDLERRVAAAPDDLAARLELGRVLSALGRAADGLEHLLFVVERDRRFQKDAARKAMIEIFETLGEEDPTVGEYRRRLQMLLF